MTNNNIVIFSILIFVVTSCQNQSDENGVYRKSTDGSQEVLYLEDGLALYYYPEVKKGIIALSRGLSDADLKSQTPDQITKDLIDNVKLINIDRDSGLIFGEIYIHDGADRFFLLNVDVAQYFSDIKALHEAMISHGADPNITPLTCRSFIDREINSKQP